MKRDSRHNSSERRLTEKARAVNVMLVYEDLQTGLRGQSAYMDLQRLWHPKPIFGDTLWHFNLLRDPQFRAQAVVDACNAHLIILSLHGRTALPPELVDWLKHWTDEKEKRQYIIYLLLDQAGGAGDDGDFVKSYMVRVAETAGADLCMSVKDLMLPGMRLHNVASLNATPLGREREAWCR